MDPLSGIASVLSVADIALRSCEGLRDLISDLRDAPQSVQRLRRTIQNTESVLRNVRLNVAEFNSSTLATEYHEVLPEAVERCVEEIRDDLNLLENILAPDDSNGKMWKRIGHVWRKKAVEEISRRVDSQQNTLSLALQSAAERRGIRLHCHVLDQRNEILVVQENLKTALLDAGKTNVPLLEGLSNMQRDGLAIQTSLSTAIEDISSSVLNTHVETSAQLKQMQSMLSDVRLDQSRTQIDRSLKAITKSALIPIVRAELRDIILPTINHNKSYLDQQMERTRHAIDGIAQGLGHILNDEPTSDDHAWMQNPAPTVSKYRRLDETCSGSSLDKHEIPLSDNIQRRKDCPGDQQSLWNQTWTYARRWSIGFLCVRILTSRVRRDDGATSQAFGRSTSAWSEEIYHLSITFQPADRVLSRGISLALGSRYDQSGYYLRCPEISVFAIIPDGSEVLGLARTGNIQGLKRLFVQNLASPTDRDRNGRTVLHVAAVCGQYDVCEFLINEGADPCVTDTEGFDCLKIMHYFTLDPASALLVCDSREAASHMMMSNCATTRLFLRNGCDIQETYTKTLGKHPFLNPLRPIPAQERHPEWSEKPIWQNESHYMRLWLDFLRDQNIDVDHPDRENWTLLQNSIVLQQGDSASYQRSTDGIFMLCAMGANVSARVPVIGAQPLHLVARTPYSPEKACYVKVQFEILLHFGADPCAQDRYGMTVTKIAIAIGWQEQWVQALSKCNKLQVVIEQLRALIAGGNDAPLDDAMRTGVDVTDLSKPSFKGLSRRTVGRGDRLDD